MTGNVLIEYETGQVPVMRLAEQFCFSNCDQLWFALT
jgi:hypothetical protein